MTRGAVDTAERREAIAVMCERARLDVARTPPSRGPFAASRVGRVDDEPLTFRILNLGSLRTREDGQLS